MVARPEAGEGTSTLRGYHAAVPAAEDLGSIGPTIQQLHKRIAQAVSKPGLQPYLPPEGLCVLVERAELQCGALPIACVAVLCWIVWLRVGEVSGFRMGGISVPLWLRFWNSKTGEEGWQSCPISPWADGYREALLWWAEAKGLRPNDHLFPGGSAWLEHKFLEVLGSTLWRHCRWHSLRRGGGTACYARHPQLQLFIWWGRWRSVGTALRLAPRPLPADAGSGGGGGGGATRVLTRLQVWAPNMNSSEAEPLQSWRLLTVRTSPPPPPPADFGAVGGEGFQQILWPGRGVECRWWSPAPPSPDPGERGGGGGASLPSTLVTVPRQREGGGDRPGWAWGSWSSFTLGTRVRAPISGSKFQGRRREGGHTGKRLDACPVLQAWRVPLEWWAVLRVYMRARLARRWRWVHQRRGAGLMPAGAVRLGMLGWSEPEPRLARRRSVGGSARRSRRRRARRPPAWLTLHGWLHGPQDLFDPPPRDPVTQPELWDCRGV